MGYVKRTLTGNARAARNASCETPLGDLIADAMRAATGADIAFMNPGGIRADLVAKREGRPDFAVTYGDAFEVQPFGSTLITMTLRGAQIARAAGSPVRQPAGTANPAGVQGLLVSVRVRPRARESGRVGGAPERQGRSTRRRLTV